MVSLGADLACEAQGVHDCLLARFDFPQGETSLVPELEIVAEDFEDLLVRDLEAQELVDFLVVAGLALDSHNYLLILVNDRLH